MTSVKQAFVTLKPLLGALVALGIGLALGGLLALLAGENPWHVIEVMITGALGTAYDRGMVIYFATILIATGLAVAIPFQAGVFNIGAEGQTLVSALACAIVGLNLSPKLPSAVAVALAVLAAMVAGGIWGGVAGGIRAFRGGHEVISSIMLNFIAAGLTGWLVVGRFQAADSQNPETAMIAENVRLKHFEQFNQAPVSMAIVASLMAAILFWIVLEKTRVGLRLKAVRQSPEAAHVAGFRVANVRFWAFLWGSAMCGIAGAAMVLGESGRFRMEMSEGFGFLGIPVALLGRGRPLGVVLAAFLFAALHHGASALDIEATKVTRDLAQVIEAIIVLCVVAEAQWAKRRA